MMSTWRAAIAAGVAALALTGPAAAQRDTAGARRDTVAARRDSGRAPASAPARTPAVTLRAGGAPVLLGGDTVFLIRARVGSFGADERAAAVQRRLERLTEDPYFRVDSLRLVPGEASTDIVAGDQVVMTVTDADAAASGVTRAELARRYLQALQRVLRRESLAVRLRTIALGAAFALLALLATFVIVRLVGRVFARAARAVEAGRTTWVPALRLQKQELVSTAQMADALLWTLRVLRFVLVVLLLYLTLPIILYFFPWTRPYADRLFGYILDPFVQVWGAFTGYVPNLFTIGAIAVFTYFLLRAIRLVFDGIERGNVSIAGFYAEWANPTYKLVRALVLVFALIMMWPYLPGSDSPAFKGVGVILGLLISLGSASAISNVVGGVVLTYMRPFKVGDRVKIADTVGDVVERNLLVTRIRTIKNVDITIPNAMVLSNHIVNYSSVALETGVILHTTVTIGYDAPWRQVHALLIAAAAATEGVLLDPPPFVLQTSLDDFYVSYELNAYTAEPNRMATIYSELHAHIQDRFNEAGVEIMSPHYRAARDGNATTVPSSYLPRDYRQPAFRIEEVSEANREDGHIHAGDD